MKTGLAGWPGYELSLHVWVTTLALRWQQETHKQTPTRSQCYTHPASRSCQVLPPPPFCHSEDIKKEKGKENPDFVLHSLLSLIVKNTFFSKGLTVQLTELAILYRCSPDWDHILAPNLSFLPLLSLHYVVTNREAVNSSWMWHYCTKLKTSNWWLMKGQSAATEDLLHFYLLIQNRLTVQCIQHSTACTVFSNSHLVAPLSIGMSSHRHCIDWSIKMLWESPKHTS